ncbi:MAG: hypothetical protein OES53_02425, partial [Xanthomonadales bacterium]|nr:hypothetical protein [Xanthomonadales bacterium]
AARLDRQPLRANARLAVTAASTGLWNIEFMVINHYGVSMHFQGKRQQPLDRAGRPYDLLSKPGRE